MEKIILDTFMSKYELFLLVFTRVSGIFIFSPLFGGENIPAMFKAGLSLTLSLVLTLSGSTGLVNYEGLWFLLVIEEFLIGLIIGYIAYVFLSAFFVMGQIVDMRIGFSMANVIDPQSKIQVPLTGNLYYMLAFLLMLSFNGHHLIIRALRDSYSTIPIGLFSYNKEVLTIIIDACISSFELGFKLSGPIVVVIFLVDIVMGIMARTIPQMNVFVVGMPLKLMVGLFIMLVGMPIFFGGVQGIFEDVIGHIYEFMEVCR